LVEYKSAIEAEVIASLRAIDPGVSLSILA
jgi:hypothetical protein